MPATGREIQYLPFETEQPFAGLCSNPFDRQILNASKTCVTVLGEEICTKCASFPCTVCLKPAVQTCGVSGIWPSGVPAKFQVDVASFAGTIGVECFANMDFEPEEMNRSYELSAKVVPEAGFECTWEQILLIGTHCDAGFPDTPGRIEARLSIKTTGEMRLTLIGNPEDSDCTAVPPDKGGKWTIVYTLAAATPPPAAAFDNIGGTVNFPVDGTLTDPWPIPGQWCPEHMDPAALPGNVDAIPLTLDVVRTA